MQYTEQAPTPKRALTRLMLCGIFAASLFLPSAGQAMSLNVGEMSLNGLTVQKLSCQLRGGGFFASMAIVGALAKQKKRMDRCARKGAAFAVKFVWKGKRRSVKVTHSQGSKAKACIRRALLRVKPRISGRCSLIVLAGKKKRAKKMARKLKKRLHKKRTKKKAKKPKKR